MDNNDDLLKSLTDIKKVSDNKSWFRGAPHRWAAASLPLAYAVACVEVVAKSSKKAGENYQEIIEAWQKPGLKEVYEAIISEVPASELEKAKEALIHPETEFLPDPNKPFKELEELFTGLEIDNSFIDEILKNGDSLNGIMQDNKLKLEQAAKLICLILEFIIFGFNRESDIERGVYRVLPDAKFPWLIIAVMIRTSFESHNITLERLRYIYKLKKYKGKIIDFHKELTEKPMSRWHRRMVASGKAAKLKLKNDRIFLDAAHAWYKCRVVYPSINKYCNAPENYRADPKNISKQIRPCDDAIGYIKRLPGKRK